jgi:hypothetical protein
MSYSELQEYLRPLTISGLTETGVKYKNIFAGGFVSKRQNLHLKNTVKQSMVGSASGFLCNRF